MQIDSDDDDDESKPTFWRGFQSLSSRASSPLLGYCCLSLFATIGSSQQKFTFNFESECSRSEDLEKQVEILSHNRYDTGDEQKAK